LVAAGVVEGIAEHARALRELIEEMRLQTNAALELLEGIEARTEPD
jgi:hypothetical protein